MTVRLDHTLRIGEVTLAALVDVSIRFGHGRGSVYVAGRKKPLALLVRKGRNRFAFTPDGARLSPQELDALCADAWRLFDR